MLRHQTAAQILLILSIFNLVLASPVVREIYDAPDDVVVPVVVRNVEVMWKERRGSDLDGPTPLDSFKPPPDEPTPSHSSLPLPDESTPLLTPSPSDPVESASFDKWLTPQLAGGSASSAVLSSRPSEIGPATPSDSDEPVPVHSTSSTSHWQDNTATWDNVWNTGHLYPEANARLKRLKTIRDVTAAVGAIIVVGDLLWRYRHNLHHRTIDPDDLQDQKGLLSQI